MLNIQDYQRYSGEKKIALMDNSTVSFLEQVERAGISTKELLKDYDAILIPTGFQKKSVIRFIGRTILRGCMQQDFQSIPSQKKAMQI